MCICMYVYIYTHIRRFTVPEQQHGIWEDRTENFVCVINCVCVHVCLCTYILGVLQALSPMVLRMLCVFIMFVCMCMHVYVYMCM